MKILITGAAGFMGSHLSNMLTSKGYKNVYGIDDLSGGFERNLDPKSTFVKLDLRNRRKTEVEIKKIKPDLIYHLAADAAEGRSQFVPISCSQRNYQAYLNLLVPSIKNGLKKIVLVSSMSVYGAQQAPFSEEQIPQPEDIYGISKYAMEKTTAVLSNVFGFKYTIIRPHNVYGPKQNFSDPYRNVIAIFINSLLRNKRYFIYGDGKQKRAFTYIDDCIPYILNSGFEVKTNGEPINIGPEKYYSINQLSNLILNKFFDKKIPSRFKPKYLKLRPQEVVEAYCTAEKAKRLLAFKESVNLNQGIEKTIEWAKKIGPQNPKYIKKFELENTKVPITWQKKLI